MVYQWRGLRRHGFKRWRTTLTLAAVSGAIAGSIVSVGVADAAAVSDTADVPSSTVTPARRDAVLPADWRQSADTAFTTVGAADGLHVLVADARAGYTWRTAATLAERGVQTDRWVGNACLTGSGRRIVVAYGPRQFANDPALAQRGGFTAVVDLVTGEVRRVPLATSLAYFNPGCGAGETAVLTQEGDEFAATRLSTLDATTGVLAAAVEVRGQLTSAVPAAGGIVASGGHQLVRVGPAGQLTALANTAGPPFRLHVDAAGGVSYLDRLHDQVRAERTVGTTTATLATGRLGSIGLRSGAGGRVFLTGTAEHVNPLPQQVTRLDVPAAAEVSSRGDMALSVDPDAIGPVRIHAVVPARHSAVQFSLTPQASAVSAVEGSPNDPVDADRWCSVPRNDPRTMVYQPTPRQVEWAADEAVQGALTFTRPANFKNFGLPAYSPQGWFPPRPLTGGGHVAVQVLLGVLAQESNLWQASGHAMSGEYGNPLVSNFYGRSSAVNAWDISWQDADCGYGVAQVTDGMRLAGHEKPGETALPPAQQRAVALDYVTNIAAGLRILQDKWNQVWAANMLVNNGDPTRIENWFFAAWAYNTGLHPEYEQGQNNGAWGLGWLNNPVNPRYPADRDFFMADPSDAAHPQDWPYEEKVIGFATYSIATPDGPGFRAAWWVNDYARAQAMPQPDLFCNDSNNCEPGQSYPPTDPSVSGEPAGPCAHTNAAGQYDLKCWYHRSVVWKDDCPTACGHELIRFDTTYPEQPDGTHYPPVCDRTALPSGAVVVDDVPDATPDPRCGRPTAGSGTFALDFASDHLNRYSSKVNFHQLGGGDEGHFWFAQTIPCPGWTYPGYSCDSATDTEFLRVTATWTPPASVRGWTRIKVHVPDHGAQTEQADYHIDLGGGSTRHRVVNQHRNRNTWVDLGTFNLQPGAAVRLSNQTPDGSGVDIAFDAVAFVPGSQPTVSYVAMGDSYSAGEGLQPFDPESDFNDSPAKDSCHRASRAYSRMVKLPGHTATIEQEAAEGQAEFHFVACSGAITTSVTSDAIDGPGQNDGENTDWHGKDWHSGELPQVDQGYLDPDTTLVTLSVGGNDIRFADVMKGCIANLLHGCDSAEFKLTHGGQVDPRALFQYEPHVIQDLLPGKLQAVYLAMHDRAPNARIVIVGYPRLFHASNPGPCVLAPVGSAATMLNHFADLLDDTIHTTVADLHDLYGYDIRFVDPRDAFDGHGSCDSGNYVNGITAPDSSGSGSSSPTGMGSFHPTTAGQSAYAGLVEAAMT